MKSTVTTPSGLTIYYQDEGKRLYRVNKKEVPSVTTILDVLNKPAMAWWGMKIGVKGICTLADMGVITEGEMFTSDHSDQDVDALVSLLTEHKLTVNHVRDQAGERGVSVHDAFEAWSSTGSLPLASEYPDTERGYVEGLRRFLEDASPEPEMAEVIVGSEEHSYAGRFDLLASQTEREVVVRASKRPKKALLPVGRYLYDLKTSKDVYPSHHLQLAAYEGALRECGYKATQNRAIIRVGADGTYAVVLSDKPYFQQFLAVRGAYAAMQTFKKGK